MRPGKDGSDRPHRRCGEDDISYAVRLNVQNFHDNSASRSRCRLPRDRSCRTAGLHAWFPLCMALSFCCIPTRFKPVQSLKNRNNNLKPGHQPQVLRHSRCFINGPGRQTSCSQIITVVDWRRLSGAQHALDRSLDQLLGQESAQTHLPYAATTILGGRVPPLRWLLLR